LTERLCIPGYYRPNQYVDCVKCGPGKYNPNNGGQCTQCPVGKKSKNQFGSDKCVSCPAGKRSTSPTSETCSKCPAGTYQKNSGKGFCRPCEVGRYSATTGRTTDCILCSPGKYGPTTGLTSCSKCDKGERQPAQGQPGCLDCQVGKYNSLEGQPQCTSCLAGTVAPNEKSITCTDCTPGKNQPNLQQTECNDCPAGKFSKAKASECDDCPDGQYNDESRSDRCTDQIICDKDLGFLEKKGSPAPSKSQVRTCGLCKIGTEFLHADGSCHTCTTESDCPPGQTLVTFCSPTSDATCGEQHGTAEPQPETMARITTDAEGNTVLQPASEHPNKLYQGAFNADVCFKNIPVGQWFMNLRAQCEETYQQARGVHRDVSNDHPGTAENTCQSGFYGLDDNDGCKPCDTCLANETMVRGCNDHHNRICEPTVDCASLDNGLIGMNNEGSLVVASDKIIINDMSQTFKEMTQTLSVQLEEMKNIVAQLVAKENCPINSYGPNCDDCILCTGNERATQACSSSTNRECESLSDLPLFREISMGLQTAQDFLKMSSQPGKNVYIGGLTMEGHIQRASTQKWVKAFHDWGKTLHKFTHMEQPDPCCQVPN